MMESALLCAILSNKIKQCKVVIRCVHIENFKTNADYSVPEIGFYQIAIIRKISTSAINDLHPLSQMT